MNLKIVQKSASVVAMLALVLSSFAWAPPTARATSTPEPDTCNEEFTYTFSSKDSGDFGDDFSKPANIDYINTSEEGEPNNLTVSADAGFVITKVEVSVDDDGISGFTQIATGPITNVNPTGTELNVTKVTVKKICPSVTVNQAVSQPDPTGTSPINFTIVFSESVTGFNSSDVTITGTAGGSKSVVVTGSGTTYNAAVSGMTTNGTVVATVGANVATGAGSHGNTPSTSTDNTVTWDRVSPTVTINQAGSQVDPTSTSPINFTVVFSENVTDFDDASDVVLSGSAGATTAVITGGPATYNVAVSGMTSGGTVIATVPASAAKDAANNLSGGSTSSDNEVTYQVDVCTNLSGMQTSLPAGHEFASAGICVVIPQCRDGVDNADTEDTLADANDPGCWTNPNDSGTYNPNDTDETTPADVCPNDSGIQTSTEQCTPDACANIDGFQATVPAGYETLSAGICTVIPQCRDNVDNDEDGKKDYPADPGCESGNDTSETDPAPTKAFVHTAKVICESEADLPNWGNNGPSITSTSASDWVAASDGDCYLAKSWEFQWAPSGTSNPGDNVEEAGSPWTTFSGILELLNPNGGTFWFREVLPEGWLAFSGDTESPYNEVSAEMYCGSDVLHYDNYDFLSNVTAGQSYYCVAFNVAPSEEPVSCSVGTELLVNGGFEAPVVTNAANWDIFPSGTAGLGWLAAWTNPTGAPTVANIELQKDGLNGWLTPFGSQWAELDSDWNGHAPGPNNEAGGIILSQDIATEVGATYTFSFDFAARPDASSAAQNTVEVYADAVLLGTVSSSNTAWIPQSFSFVATDTLTTVAIRYAGTPNDSVGAFVDNASAKCTADACVGEKKTMTVVSDATTKVGSNNATVLTPQPGGTIHPAWTASIPGASWIWSTEPLPDAASEVTETFTKSFTINGTPNAASLMIAADNSYQVFVNGSTTPTCADATEDNYSASGQDLCNIPAWALTSGSNTLTFKVKNLAQSGGVPSSNPAGLLYKLSVDYTTSCDEPTEETGTFVLVKKTEGGDGLFSFLLGPSEIDEEVSVEAFSVEEYTKNVETEEGEGSLTQELEEGWYTVSELVPEGWDYEGVTCTTTGENTKFNYSIEGGVEFYVEAGETVTCTFTNEKESGSSDVCPNIDGFQDYMPRNYGHNDEGECIKQSRSGGRSGPGGGGEVLGAATCGPLLTQYLNIAWDNDESEVTKLQQFLNEHLGLTLPVTGLFGPATLEAVKQFQTQYASSVLHPWIGFPGSGIDGDNDPTGFVYQTTRWQINNIWCPGSEEFPTLI